MAGMTRIGLGLHVIYLKPEWAHPLGAGGIAALTILPLATYTVKASILLLLGRIFSTQKFKTILWIFFTIFTAFCLASFFAELLQCWPIGSQLTGKAKRCINWDALFTSLSFINAFFDTILLALPLPMIWKLHTNVRRKVQTSAIFLVGLIAVTASFIRAGYSLKSSKVDVSYADAFVALWATVEVNTSIVSACMPNYGPLVMKVLDRKRLSGKRGSYAYDSGDKYSYQKWPSSVNKSDTKITAAGSLHAPSEDVEMGAYRNLSLDEHERLRSATRHQ
ncbi:MAG: hypothetical protein M1821_002542 [Bathelium mastoideum]|nr:MAG: hypothetical protein M1821_002542 [Bathelium mastoideum]